MAFFLKMDSIINLLRACHLFGRGLFALSDADLNIVDRIFGIFIVHKFHEDIIAQGYNIYNIYNTNLYNLTDIDIKKVLI